MMARGRYPSSDARRCEFCRHAWDPVQDLLPYGSASVGFTTAVTINSTTGRSSFVMSIIRDKRGRKGRNTVMLWPRPRPESDWITRS